MATYANPIKASALNPTVAYDMVGKTAKTIIRGVTGDNRLAELHRGMIENGESVEDVVFGLVEGSALVNTVPGTPFSAPEAVPHVYYFKDWNTTQYATGLTQRNLRKYLTEGKSVEEVAAIVAGQLAQSAETDDYENIRDMFHNQAEALNAMVDCSTAGIVSSPESFKDVIFALKEVVSQMTFTNDKCNAAGIKRRTLADDIVIIMPASLYNKLEVEELAGVFNLSKVELKEKIILTDDTTLAVIDKNAAQVWTRLYEMSEAWDAQQLRMNYFLTVDRIYGLSPLYDAVLIPYKIPGLN